MALSLRPASQCRFDQVSLGECMVRLSPPGHGRLEFASTLEVWVGGGEYNVACAVSRLGLRAGWIGALVENPVGRIILNHARSQGLDTSHVVWKPWDQVGRDARIGLNFSEVGIGPRPSITMYDRGHSATTAMTPADVDWAKLYTEQGVRWLHTGGIFTALSASTRATVLEAVTRARLAGTVVSYDLNYRKSLWSIRDAVDATRPLLPHVNCFIGNIGQFEIVLGKAVEGFDLETDRVEPWAFQKVVEEVTRRHPQVTTLATTLREVRSGLVNDFSALMWHEGQTYTGPRFENLEIEDRVGGGDAFAGGLVHGLLTGASPQEALDLATAAGALAHTTRGDNAQFTLDEVRKAAKGGSARIVR